MDIKTVNNNALGRSNDSLKPTIKESEYRETPTATHTTSDKVTLTQTVSQMNTLEQTARHLDTGNSSRIAELKQAIQEGNYQVNPEKIADKLLQTEALFAKF